MKTFLSLLLLAVALGCASIPEDIVVVNPRYGGGYEILDRDLSASGMTYVFRGAMGIFSFDLVPPPASVRRVTFVLKEQGRLESLSLHPVDTAWVELYTPNSPARSGIAVTRKGPDWTITFTGEGLNELRKGGRFQVINEWRR